MAKILTSLCLLLSVSAFAGGKAKTAAPKKDRKPNAEARVLTGQDAEKLFVMIQGNQDAECGMGKCWVGGKVSCAAPTNPKEGHTECEIMPLD